MNQSHWYLGEQNNVPDDFKHLIQSLTQQKNCHYLARLLWNRGIRDIQSLEDILGNNHYQPTSYLELGDEISLALERINEARLTNEKVAIWGCWQVGSILTACVLKAGLQQFLSTEEQLRYYFPERYSSYFGLNYPGIEQLRQEGITLLITANTGIHNVEEVNYAQSHGLDIIIIDRPVLSCPPSPALACLNTHSLPPHHPCYHLSAVAIAYKLLEGLATEYPDEFAQPITSLLDLVALGLLADKVNLRGEGRYLAREGIQLIKQKKRHNITKLAENGFQMGDRALDLSYGIVNRITAVTSIYSNVDFLIDLLTNDHPMGINRLADRAEKAYLNSLDLAQKILQEARQKIQRLNLSNSNIITINQDSWPSSLFPLIAENLLQEFGKPLIFITNNFGHQSTGYSFAYIYSLPDFNLSPLVSNCSDLLEKLIIDIDSIKVIFPTENLVLFQEILAQKIRQKINGINLRYHINIDLLLKLNELSESLYQELKLLEPYNYSDNPYPRILIRNCQLKNIFSINLKNKIKKKQTKYKKTSFEIYNQEIQSSFAGICWHDFAQKINEADSYDLVGEIEYNTDKKTYYFRVLDLKKYSLSQENFSIYTQLSTNILDYRHQAHNFKDNNCSEQILKNCPSTWKDIIHSYKKAIANQQNLVLAYEHHGHQNHEEIDKKCTQFMGLLKYLLVHDKSIGLISLAEKINISLLSLQKISRYLYLLNIEPNIQENILSLDCQKNSFSVEQYQLFQEKFRQIVQQENLSKQYFYQASVNDLKQVISLVNEIKVIASGSEAIPKQSPNHIFSTNPANTYPCN